MILLDGSVYEGEYKDDKREGYGEIIFKHKKESYKGYFKGS